MWGTMGTLGCLGLLIHVEVLTYHWEPTRLQREVSGRRPGPPLAVDSGSPQSLPAKCSQHCALEEWMGDGEKNDVQVPWCTLGQWSLMYM